MELDYFGIAIVPLLIGILEVFKKLGLSEKYIPITSLILGIGIGVALFGGTDIKEGIVQGTFIGLSAVGLYSGTRSTLNK